MKLHIKPLGFLIIFLLISCDDPEEHPIKATGSFRSVSSNGLVTFKLVQGAGETKAISTSMLDNEYSISSGVLSVNGIGTMTIAVGGYTYITCNSCEVKGSGPILTDTLAMSIHAGSAKFNDLTVTRYLQLNALNTGTYKFIGSVPFFNVSCVNLANIEAYDLVTDSTYVNTTCAIDTEVHATKVINVFINSIGDVNYKGNPAIIRRSGIGSGKLIAK